MTVSPWASGAWRAAELGRRAPAQQFEGAEDEQRPAHGEARVGHPRHADAPWRLGGAWPGATLSL